MDSLDVINPLDYLSPSEIEEMAEDLYEWESERYYNPDNPFYDLECEHKSIVESRIGYECEDCDMVWRYNSKAFQ